MSDALGLVLLAVGGLLLGGGTSQGTGKLLPGLVVSLAAIRFAFTGLYELTGAGGWQDASGAIGLAVAALALYLVWALELEDPQDHPVLPTLRRGRGERAVTSPGADQLSGIEHEPGVRQQL